MRAEEAAGGNAGASPRALARMTGLFYLLTMVAGIVAQGFISNRLVVLNDAATTAANILAHTGLFRLGFTLYMVEMTCNVIMIVLFYQLLKPAGRTLALLAAALGVTGCVIKTFSRVFFITPLFLLEGALHATGVNLQQVQEQALVLLKVNDQGAGMALAFAGCFAVLTGWLILRCTFLPRVLGAISVVAGLGWLTFMTPALGFGLFPYIAALGFLGAAALIAWLLVVGVDEPRWKVQADTAGSSIWR